MKYLILLSLIGSNAHALDVPLPILSCMGESGTKYYIGIGEGCTISRIHEDGVARPMPEIPSFAACLKTSNSVARILFSNNHGSSPIILAAVFKNEGTWNGYILREKVTCMENMEKQ